MAEEFDILLQFLGDEGADYRHQNYGDEIEREIVIDRKEDMYTGCELLPVIHGYMDLQDKTPASLVIFDFRFQGNNRQKRFVKSHMRVKFADEQQPGNPSFDPVVTDVSFAPNGGSWRHAISPTMRQKEVKRAANLSVGGTAFGLNITAGLVYEVSQTVTKSACATLDAAKRVEGRPVGRKNLAEWDLTENPYLLDGIPTFMRVAILLQRPKGNSPRRFTAEVSVDAKLAFGPKLTDIRDVLGLRKVPPVDPVIFDPERKRAVQAVIDIDPDNLEKVNVQELSVLLKENQINY